MAELEILGSAEVAELLGVSKQTLANWRARNASFPAPVAELRSGPIWRKVDIVAWARSAGVHILEGRGAEPDTLKRSRRAVVVAVVNMKGGVGKSTVTANLGWYSAYKRDKRVLMVDLDPQFNLSQYALGTDRYEELLKKNRPTVYEVFEQTTLSPLHRKQSLKAEDTVCHVVVWPDGSRLDLVPSRLDLAWTLKSSYDKKEHFSNFVDSLRRTYDLILIDCPPTQSVLTDAAFLASDYILIPVKPEYLSTIGLPLLAKSLEDYRKQHKDHNIEIAGILFNAVSSQKGEHQKSMADVNKVARQHGWYVFKNEIAYSDSYPKGSREGKPIFLTGYVRTERVMEFDALANEFAERVGL